VLGRVGVHEVTPYQPDAYLGASGGAGRSVTSTISSRGGAGKVFVPGTEPSNWQQPRFDDSAWAASYQQPDSNLPAQIPGTQGETALLGLNVPGNAVFLYRRTFSVQGPVPAATLTVYLDDYATGIWLNGTLIGSTVTGAGEQLTLAVPSSAFVVGLNVCAIRVCNFGGNPGSSGMSLDYQLTLAVNAPGAFQDPTTTEGDILVRQTGALTRLPLGAAGQVLTVVAGEPAWAAQAASGGGTPTLYAPLVNGDLPGPSLMADGAGQCIMVQT